MTKDERVELDPDTKAWFKTRPGAQTTVAQCPKCGLFYKPSLGHKVKNCEVKNGHITNV